MVSCYACDALAPPLQLGRPDVPCWLQCHQAACLEYSIKSETEIQCCWEVRTIVAAKAAPTPLTPVRGVLGSYMLSPVSVFCLESEDAMSLLIAEVLRSAPRRCVPWLLMRPLAATIGIGAKPEKKSDPHFTGPVPVPGTYILLPSDG